MWVNFNMFAMMWHRASRKKSAWDFEGLNKQPCFLCYLHLDIPQASKTWHVQGQIHLLPSLVFPVLVGITQSPKLEVIFASSILSMTPHIPPFNQLSHLVGFSS